MCEKDNKEAKISYLKELAKTLTDQQKEQLIKKVAKELHCITEKTIDNAMQDMNRIANALGYTIHRKHK